jgi:sugar lactone lactonase YvrE
MARTGRVVTAVVVVVAALGLSPARGAATGDIRTVAGVGESGYGGDGGPALGAQLNEPRTLVVDRAGTMYIVDTFNHRIRKVDASGVMTTLAGTGVAGEAGDGGPADQAEIHWPHAASLDAAEANLYIADSPNHRIRKVDLATGIITTVVGSGAGGFDGDGGPATAAKLNDPKGVLVGPGGEIYIADSGNDRIRLVDPSGIISTLAGTGATGYGGDGGPATEAVFNGPRSLALDGAGNLYIADDNNDRIRRIDMATRIVSTYAGTGKTGYGGDEGPAAQADLSRPRGIAMDPAGHLYIADSMNHRVRLVDPSGRITTVVGTGRKGYGGDGGPATQARVFTPRGVATDVNGNLYVADTYNDRIRQVAATPAS